MPDNEKDQVLEEERPYIRPANEDDDLYDPYSDRPARQEPLFERDPWS